MSDELRAAIKADGRSAGGRPRWRFRVERAGMPVDPPTAGWWSAVGELRFVASYAAAAARAVRTDPR